MELKETQVILEECRARAECPCSSRKIMNRLRVDIWMDKDDVFEKRMNMK